MFATRAKNCPKTDSSDKNSVEFNVLSASCAEKKNKNYINCTFLYTFQYTLDRLRILKK